MVLIPWDEFSEQHYHQSFKKAPNLMPDEHFLNTKSADLMYIWGDYDLIYDWSKCKGVKIEG